MEDKLDKSIIPADANSLFNQVVNNAWMRVNKRLKTKADKMAKKKPGVSDIISQFKQVEMPKNQIQPDGQIEEEEEPEVNGGLEDVRMSNFAYSQTKIAEYLTFYFAAIGVGSAVIASEINYGHNGCGKGEQWIKIMLIVCNISTLPFIIAIIMNKFLYIRWQRTKLQYSELDSICNTGAYKMIIFEIIMSLIMPYPMIYGITYQETANTQTVDTIFHWNDWLLAIMIFCRIPYLIRYIISISWYAEPRAQRVCKIYGCDASYGFALKAIMKESPWRVLGISMVVTLIMLSYQMRLFERQVDPAFNHITNAMWVMLITLATVGYGDLYPRSHMGRMIGITIAFWGVFYVSLFVVALTNILNFESVESKAYMLLQRLKYKEDLREEAAGMLSATYRIKLLKRSDNLPENKKDWEILMQKRNYRCHKQEFSKIARQIRNITDNDADMENLKNGVDSLLDDVSLIRMAQYFVYHDTRKLKKALAKKKDNKDKEEQWTDED